MSERRLCEIVPLRHDLQLAECVAAAGRQDLESRGAPTLRAQMVLESQAAHSQQHHPTNNAVTTLFDATPNGNYNLPPARHPTLFVQTPPELDCARSTRYTVCRRFGKDWSATSCLVSIL
jgi:hypothetical protein